MTRDWSALPSANSLWAAMAEPAHDFTVLSGEQQADVVIIGAGYTGLSAAHHIAKSGLSPIVIEANRPRLGRERTQWRGDHRKIPFVVPRN